MVTKRWLGIGLGLGLGLEEVRTRENKYSPLPPPPPPRRLSLAWNYPKITLFWYERNSDKRRDFLRSLSNNCSVVLNLQLKRSKYRWCPEKQVKIYYVLCLSLLYDCVHLCPEMQAVAKMAILAKFCRLTWQFLCKLHWQRWTWLVGEFGEFGDFYANYMLVNLRTTRDGPNVLANLAIFMQITWG